MVMVSLAESSGIPSRKYLWILFSQRNAHKPRTSLLEEVKWFWIYTNMKVKNVEFWVRSIFGNIRD